MSESIEDRLMCLAAEIAKLPPAAPRRLVQVESALALLRAYMTIATPEGRLTVWSYLQGGYCRSCGGDRLPCHCENDE